jgi:hypothetical protein
MSSRNRCDGFALNRATHDQAQSPNRLGYSAVDEKDHHQHDAHAGEDDRKASIRILIGDCQGSGHVSARKDNPTRGLDDAPAVQARRAAHISAGDVAGRAREM